MRRWSNFVSLWAVCFIVSAASAAEPAPPPSPLTVITDRPDALYSVGQKVKFTITLKESGGAAGAEVGFTLSKDGFPTINQGKLKLDSAGCASLEGTLAEPGFLLLTVSYAPKGKPSVTARAGAGFDPLKIAPSLPVPDDFDAFWDKQKAALAAVPMKPTLTPAKSPIAGIDCFDVQITCAGPRPVSGYFARPSGAKPKSLPAILSVHGAGVRSSSLPGPAGAAKAFNALAMDINAHGIPNGKDDAFYKALADGELKDYRFAGREDREKCYFLGMFLRLMRAMDFLTSQPEWDGRVLIVRGGSQGGGQSIAAAGLNPKVTLISAGVPAICDHSGKAAGRINGWPKLVPDVDGKPDPKVLEVARYFDCMNFATRTRARALVSVGFIDTVCPPSSVYAAYNNLKGTKQIVNEPLMAHASSKKLEEQTSAAIKEHIGGK